MANKRRRYYFRSPWAFAFARYVCCDLKGVEHVVEVTADSLYEAIAQGLRAFRENDWVDNVGGEDLTTITIVIRQPSVERKVRVRDFEQWLEAQGRTLTEMSLKNRLREVMRRSGETRKMEARGERRAAQKGRAEIGHFIEPMACLAVADLPAGSDWEYELKLNGYRAIAFKPRGRVHVRSRTGKDLSQRFGSLIRPLQPLADETVVDCKIVANRPSSSPIRAAICSGLKV